MLNTLVSDPNADCPGWPQDYRDGYREAGYLRDETFTSMLEEIAAVHADKVAFIESECRLSYRQLAKRATALANGLTTLGLKKGDRVVVQMPNSIAFAELIFALAQIGVVPVLALPPHRHLEISGFCAFVQARAYFIPDRLNGFDYRALARELQSGLPDLEHIVVLGDAEEFVDFDSLFTERAASAALPQIAPGDVAVFQISGGTTGIPKLIPRRHDEYLYNMRTSAEMSGMDTETVYLCALPVAHNFPFACPGVMGTLVNGGTVVFASDPGPETCFALIARHGVTITSLVPPLALLWMQAAQKSAIGGLASLKTLQVGGAKMNEEAARRVRPILGCGLQQVFGMAEGLICYTRLDDDEETIMRTQGRPMSPADEIRVVDADGCDVSQGEAGELLTRGPYTIRGYYRIPEHDAKAFTADGYYRTGDIVRLTPDGYLILSGREKDQINRGGEKLSPEEVENLLLGHGGIHDAAVVGLPDDVLGERICAFVIARTEGLKPLALTRHLRAKGLASFKIPDQFIFIESFPETGIGKVSKKDLREKLKQIYQSAPSAERKG
jgi:2,3-dihydroxybenzoate-AMP ligase/pyochelin biosynthesis protein PchD